MYNTKYLTISVLFQVGAGSYLFHHFSSLVNSILVNFGLSEEMHNPVSTNSLHYSEQGLEYWFCCWYSDLYVVYWLQIFNVAPLLMVFLNLVEIGILCKTKSMHISALFRQTFMYHFIEKAINQFKFC